MSTNYTDLYDFVVPEVPMCPLPMVKNAIQQAVIDFCEQSLIWRQELQQIRVYGATSTTTSAAATAGDLTITVASTTDFNDTDTITVDLTDGTKWRGHISGTPAALVITLDGALNEDVESGATVTKLVDQYAITLPSGAAIAKGLQAWLNDSVIEPISPDDLDTEFNTTDFGWAGSNWRTDVNLPTRWYMPDDTTVGLALAPSADGNLRINAALKPSQASTNFPTWIFERYITQIAHGAIAQLQLIPSKPYSNKELGAWHMEEFNKAIAEAKIRAARGNTRAALRSHTVFGLR